MSLQTVLSSLKKKVDIDLKKKDLDCVIVIIGDEGSGKSSLAQLIALFLDNLLGSENFIFLRRMFFELIKKIKNSPARCVVLDEPHILFQNALSSEAYANKRIITLIRKRNAVLIVCSSSIDYLPKEFVFRRTNMLIKIDSDHFFKVYMKDRGIMRIKKSYVNGQNVWSFPKSCDAIGSWSEKDMEGERYQTLWQQIQDRKDEFTDDELDREIEKELEKEGIEKDMTVRSVFNALKLHPNLIEKYVAKSGIPFEKAVAKNKIAYKGDKKKMRLLVDYLRDVSVITGGEWESVKEKLKL